MKKVIGIVSLRKNIFLKSRRILDFFYRFVQSNKNQSIDLDCKVESHLICLVLGLPRSKYIMSGSKLYQIVLKITCQGWPQMVQIWDFFRSVSVNFASESQNIQKLILKKSQNVQKLHLKKFHICPIWGQSDPFWGQP